jgi:hypothetical protein
MPPPARHADVYVIGKMGSYELPTLASCQRLILQMTELLRSDVCAADPKLRARVEWDRDLCIERYGQIAFDVHTREALRASK